MENKNQKEESLLGKHLERYKYMFNIDTEGKTIEEQKAILQASIIIAKEMLENIEK